MQIIIMKKRKKIVSIIPSLEGGKGHMLSYHLAVRDACILNNWSHAALFSSTPAARSIPNGWHDVLNTGSLETQPRKLLAEIGCWNVSREIIRFSRSIRAGIKRLAKDENEEVIFFIERFNAFQLLAFVFAFTFFGKRGSSLWVMIRHEPSESFLIKKINYILIAQLRMLFGRESFRLLADSEPLGHVLSSFFKCKVDILPIPHTNHLSRPCLAQTGKVVFWWPGSPRLEKGWSIIKELAKELMVSKVSQHASLVVSDAAEISAQNTKFRIELVENILPLQKYWAMFERVDVVLLPYDSDFYKSSTSGIFVETIVSGKIPLVSDGNWMSYELRRFGLSELIVENWKLDDLLLKVSLLNKSDQAKSKLDEIRKFYISYHSTGSFAEQIKLL